MSFEMISEVRYMLELAKMPEELSALVKYDPKEET